MSWRIRLRSNEACEDQPFLTPGLVLKVGDASEVYFDFTVATPQERRNAGGLQARNALQTAIVIQLFSDARALDDDLLPDDLDPDRRGWWGDGIARIEEQGLYNVGSRLWTLRRSILNKETADKAHDMVLEALQPIVDQGAVARFEIDTWTSYDKFGWSHPETGFLVIKVRAYGRDGALSYNEQFEVLWDQVRANRGSKTSFAA